MTTENYPGNQSIPPFGTNKHADCIPANETFDGTWPFNPNFYEGNGFKQHYVDEGKENENNGTIVLLHGEPTWGYLYRNFITPLAKSHRVIVPDHMGFGKSETPQDKEYCLRTHTINLINLLQYLNVAKVTLFLQDWGVHIGTQYALRAKPGVVERIFYGSLSRPRTLAEDKERVGDRQSNGISDISYVKKMRYAQKGQRWFQWILSGIPDDPNYKCEAMPSNRKRDPWGRTEQVLLHSGSTIAHTMKHLVGFQSAENMTDTWCRAYAAQFPTVESSVGALNFPMEACGQLICSTEANEFRTAAATEENYGRLSKLPVWVAYGKEDRAIVFSEKAIQSFRKIWPNCPIIELKDCGHFIQEDCPDVLVGLIQTFIQTTGGSLSTYNNLTASGGASWRTRL